MNVFFNKSLVVMGWVTLFFIAGTFTFFLSQVHDIEIKYDSRNLSTYQEEVQQEMFTLKKLEKQKQESWLQRRHGTYVIFGDRYKERNVSTSQDFLSEADKSFIAELSREEIEANTYVNAPVWLGMGERSISVWEFSTRVFHINMTIWVSMVSSLLIAMYMFHSASWEKKIALSLAGAMSLTFFGLAYSLVESRVVLISYFVAMMSTALSLAYAWRKAEQKVAEE